MTEKLTPAEHHDQLIAAIEYEVDRYGVRSLAAIIATILEENHSHNSHGDYATLFRAIEDGTHHVPVRDPLGFDEGAEGEHAARELGELDE